MSIGNLRLFEGAIPATETTIYTNSTGKVVELEEVLVDNTTAVAAVFSLSIVPSGGTAGAANRISTGQTVAANGQYSLLVDQPILPGDFISASQVTANALTIDISGGVVPN